MKLRVADATGTESCGVERSIETGTLKSRRVAAALSIKAIAGKSAGAQSTDKGVVVSVVIQHMYELINRLRKRGGGLLGAFCRHHLRRTTA